MARLYKANGKIKGSFASGVFSLELPKPGKDYYVLYLEAPNRIDNLDIIQLQEHENIDNDIVERVNETRKNIDKKRLAANDY